MKIQAPIQPRKSTFLKSAIVSRQYTNKAGKLVGGNVTGERIVLSRVGGLNEETRKQLIKENPKARFDFEAFELIESEGNLKPSAIAKQVKALLGNDGKMPTNLCNRYVNGYYICLRKIRHLADSYINQMMDDNGLIPTHLDLKKRGTSTLSFETMREVKEPKPRKARASKLAMSEAENAKLREEIEQLKEDMRKIARGEA